MPQRAVVDSAQHRQMLKREDWLDIGISVDDSLTEGDRVGESLGIDINSLGFVLARAPAIHLLLTPNG
ncbi:hypothetical protein D3C71_1360760 [compost metagenome]